MMGLSDSEKILTICSVVLTQSMRVTERQTNRQMDRIAVAYTRYSINAVVYKNHKDHKGKSHKEKKLK